MDFKFFSKIINTKSKANIFNFLFSLLLWGLFFFLNFYILVNGDAKHFFSYFVCFLVGVLFSLLIIKVIIFDFYKKKWLIIFFLVILPALFFIFVNIFVFLWETTSFIGPTIL
jgi:hypothetical protein